METGFFVHYRTESAVLTVEFVSGRVSYIDLRGHLFTIIDLNVHAPSEEKSDDSRDSFFCEELEQVFYHFPKYHMKTVLGDLHDKMVGTDILKPTIRNEVYIRIVMMVQVVLEQQNLSHQKNLFFKSTVCRTDTYKSTPGHLPIGRPKTKFITYSQIRDDIRVYSMYDLSGDLIVILITMR